MHLPEFDDCLKRKKIVRFPAAKKLAINELVTAKEDLATCEQSLELKNYKWATVQAYYVMFHAARALLYYKGYREKSHYCLILAMKSFYVSKGVLEMGLVESLQMAKVLRENADYKNDFDVTSAKALAVQAKEFVKIASDVVVGLNGLFFTGQA